MMFFSGVRKLATIDIFKEAKKHEMFVGRPYYVDYEKAHLLIADAWKNRVRGIPQNSFLLAFYENENDSVSECFLLRTIRPTKLPTDSDMIASMIEYYKDSIKTSGKDSQIDDYTRYSFSFSGLECKIVGTFFKDRDEKIKFGGDVENFYSAINYVVYKPTPEVLEQIVNFRDGVSVVGNGNDIKIGRVRYSSSQRFQEDLKNVNVYVNPQDFLGKRTALFGMTRTGKSNTIKKIIEATTELSEESLSLLEEEAKETALRKIPHREVSARSKGFPLFPEEEPPEKNKDSMKQFEDNGSPRYKAGQIIFDINGEYANANMQDDGTAIFVKYESITTRYSVLEKEGFRVLKVNFYNDVKTGFELLASLLSKEDGDYIKSLLAIDFDEPDADDRSSHTRWERKVAAYQCCLAAAGFEKPSGFRIKFLGNNEINSNIKQGQIVDPAKGISTDDATEWFSWVAENQDHKFFQDYKKKNGHDWVDDDLKALLVMLTRKRSLSGSANITGYRKLAPFRKYHTTSPDMAFETEIVKLLRDGAIVIIDLSQGDPEIQGTYSKKICRRLFTRSMENFIANKPNNFVQFYFEEAHNLFPKRDDTDLTQIYNRIAKEGAKLNLGMVYATQEVSSISSNILKNTQNWFIAHLNNEDELKEIKKFYDFGDFCDGLMRYSAGSDKGFVRMKVYSNTFAVPVQIDRFSCAPLSGDEQNGHSGGELP